MKNSYYIDIIWNSNFQNAQNYVFPQKNRIIKEVYILETRILWMKLPIFILTTFWLFTFSLVSVMFLGPISAFIWMLATLGLLYFVFYFITFLLITLLQVLNILTFKQKTLHSLYINMFKIYKRMFQERSKRIYYLWEWIYLIDKWNWVYKKFFYLPERFWHLQK